MNFCSSDAEAESDCCPAAEGNVEIVFGASGRKLGVGPPSATSQELPVVVSVEEELFGQRR